MLNGCEIGGGSIRIHKASEQLYVLKNILKVSDVLMKNLTSLNVGDSIFSRVAKKEYDECWWLYVLYIFV